MLGHNAYASSIGFASINEDGTIASANGAFCKLFALDELENIQGIFLETYLAEKFQLRAADLVHAFNCSNAAIFEVRLERDADPLTVHIAKRHHGPRMLIVDQLEKPTISSGTPIPINYLDPLTGLGNRMLLDEVIKSWHPREPDALSLAVIMLDIDRFKHVNDTLGHNAGDILLKLVGKRIKSIARIEDFVIRMSGDEFIIVHTEGMQPIGSESVAHRVIELISRPFLVDGQQINISVSVGIAALNQGTDNKIDLLRHADLALYEAKTLGRGKVKFFEPGLAKRALDRRQFEVDLRRALDLQEFTLVYQPQVSLPDRLLTGFEALIRWNSPTRGLVSPVEFIPLAEELGEIHIIGEWVLRTACQEAITWDGNFVVAVNVSPVQFENDNIIDIIQDALVSSGLPPHRLEVEITEGVLMKDIDRALERLWAIKALGVGIAMDDFGTGYSSLSYLNSFPFSKIKIDQLFVRGEKSSKSKALVKAIVALGASLDMTTLAEGVETEEQFNELAIGGCMEAQGYLISRPIPPNAIAEFIAMICMSLDT